MYFIYKFEDRKMHIFLVKDGLMFIETVQSYYSYSVQSYYSALKLPASYTLGAAHCSDHM